MKTLALASALAVAAPSPVGSDFEALIDDLRRVSIQYGYTCRDAGVSLETCLRPLKKREAPVER